MTATTEMPTNQSESLLALIDNADNSGPQWMSDIRNDGAKAYNDLGLPTTRHEEWRLTNIAPIRKTSFALSGPSVEVTADDVLRFAVPDLDGTRLVFIDGQLDSDLSHFDTLPEGVVVTTMPDAGEPEIGQRAIFGCGGCEPLKSLALVIG